MRVGFIEPGMMGLRMVVNLLKAGHQVAINDAQRQAGRPLEAQGARKSSGPAWKYTCRFVRVPDSPPLTGKLWTRRM